MEFPRAWRSRFPPVLGGDRRGIIERERADVHRPVSFETGSRRFRNGPCHSGPRRDDYGRDPGRSPTTAGAPGLPPALRLKTEVRPLDVQPRLKSGTFEANVRNAITPGRPESASAERTVRTPQLADGTPLERRGISRKSASVRSGDGPRRSAGMRTVRLAEPGRIPCHSSGTEARGRPRPVGVRSAPS